MITFTVATPTYNRADVLDRVYRSLQAQTYRNFEWVVVDDGSSDHTSELVRRWAEEADFPIRYVYQENRGKHIALNRAAAMAQGELFVIADSDDSFRSDSLQILLDSWNDIPPEERDRFRGVSCRCYDPETGAEIGPPFPGGGCDLLGLDATYRRRYCFELWGFNRTVVMREYPFPNIEGLAFYPEIIIWDRMGSKYFVRFINAPLRAYYKDQENAATNKKRRRSKENIHLWAHYLNDIFSYFPYRPKLFLKAFIGLSMDGFSLGKSVAEILAIPQKRICKLGVFLCLPLGYGLFRRRT